MKARTFDWDEAKRRVLAGESKREVADSLGVSWQAVHVAVDDVARENARITTSRWAEEHKATCVDCGGSFSNAAHSQGSRHCVACATAKQATSVREETLRCVRCRKWMPDDGFPENKAAPALRRGRHTSCRGCCTVARRDYRNRNKVPCANGCGTLVLAPNEQEASAKAHGHAATGMCHPCMSLTKRESAAAASQVG